MNRVNFEKIAPGIGLLKTPFGQVWSGVYLVCGRQNLLIDSGADRMTVDDCILPALESAGLNVDKIDWLLCTHTHGDHVGGHHRLRELGVKCGVIASGVARLRDPLDCSRRIRNEFPEYSPAPPPVLQGVDPEWIFQDGDRIGRLRVIATPGHDSDCVCYLDEESGTLLSGDSLQWNGTTAQGCALYMDLPAYRKSIERLRRERIGNIVPGHDYIGGNSLDDALEFIRIYDTFIQSHRDLPMAEIAVRLIGEIGGTVPKYLFLPLYTVREHLKQCITPTT